MTSLRPLTRTPSLLFRQVHAAQPRTAVPPVIIRFHLEEVKKSVRDDHPDNDFMYSMG